MFVFCTDDLREIGLLVGESSGTLDVSRRQRLPDWSISADGPMRIWSMCRAGRVWRCPAAQTARAVDTAAGPIEVANVGLSRTQDRWRVPTA